jgi:ribulose-5-phosphate 4-epimerase/fuculose-1-phosphate aldolase
MTMTTTATATASPLTVAYTPHQELALLLRMLHRAGYNDHIAGHVTYRQPDGTLLLNPRELTWDEVCAGDIVRISPDGDKLDGRWSVTRAIALHVELHRARHDAVVAVHHHPEWATVWSALGEVPPIYDQTGAFIPDDIAFFPEYEGDVVDVGRARENVEALGSAAAAFLGNHGVFVIADSIAQAQMRCSAIEHRSRLAWRVRSIDRGGAHPMPAQAAATLAHNIEVKYGRWEHLFEAMARREIRNDPTVLD